LIASGPTIKKGVNLYQIPMTAIGPTILRAMEIDDPQFGGQRPLLDIFKYHFLGERVGASEPPQCPEGVETSVLIRSIFGWVDDSALRPVLLPKG
jgi:hypothetical protein